MEPLAFIYVFSSLAVFLVALAAAWLDYERCRALFLCAALLFVYCLAGNLLWALLPEPDSYRLDPVLDLVAVVIIGRLHWRYPRWWTATLTLCFLTQIGLEAWFWASEAGLFMPLKRSAYEWLINALFVGQLAIVAITGGGHVAGRIVAALSARRAGRRLAAAQSRRDG